MKKVNVEDIEGYCPDDCKDLDFKELIAERMRPPNFHMRLFDIAPGGHTPRHSHRWEHEVFVIEGKGKIVLEDREERLTEGDAVLVEPDELHQFVNSGKSALRLICMIPK